MTKAQIDKLGDRLRQGFAVDRDLELLAAYRDSFRPSYVEVAAILQSGHVDVTGRTKSNLSIERKLRREPSLRLTQMQDIEGCRVVVSDYESQEVHLALAQGLFDHTKVIDRRERPSHGYRAVHVIIHVLGCDVELQIRTKLQDLWAQLSERIADEVSDPMVKYGGGPDQARDLLSDASSKIHEIELVERRIFEIDAAMDYTPGVIPEQVKRKLPDARRIAEASKLELMSILAKSVTLLERAKMKRDSGAS